MKLQITIDCVDPHRFAAFYEQAEVGYVAEDHTANVQQLIGSDQVLDLADPEDCEFCVSN